MKSSKPKAQVADYYMSIHFGVCSGPIDALRKIIVGEKEAWTGNQTTNADLTINKRDLFGGVKKEGGVGGLVAVLLGGSTQTLAERLATRLGKTTATTPGFRGLTSLFFTGTAATGGFYWGSNSPYLRAVWATVSRAPKGLSPSFATIANGETNGPDANPACMVFECLTNTDWGMGAPTTILDVPSFEACAETLYNEAFGLSMIWAAQAKIEDFITEILDHIQATLFVNPRTGLLTLKLIRNDYDINDLRVLGPDNCTVTSYQRKSWAETINEVTVTWTNPQNEEEETVGQQDLGNIQMQGGVVTDNRNYYGVRNAALANKLALRDLRVAAAPLASVAIELDRTHYDILPGECVRLTWPEYGIVSMVVRVGAVDYGRTGDSKIKIEGLEDVFALGFAEYEAGGGTLWQDPSQEPEPLTEVRALTAPLFVQAALGMITSIDSMPYPEVSALILAAQADEMDSLGFALYGERTSTAGPLEYQYITDMHLTGKSALPADIALEVETDVMDFSADQVGFEGPEVGGLVLIGAGDDTETEIAYIRAYDIDTGWTLDRGVLDTIPRAWPAGTPVWFLNAGSDAIDPSDYAAFSSPNWKLLTRTSLGLLDEADADVLTYTLTERPHLPNRPANVQINGSLWGPVAVGALDDIYVTWSIRNRTQEDSVIRKWTDSSMTPEDGQTTTITVMDTARTVLATHADLAGTDFTIPIESFADVSTAIVRVSSARDGLESLQAVEIEVGLTDREGYGYNYGFNYGGGS